MAGTSPTRAGRMFNRGDPQTPATTRAFRPDPGTLPTPWDSPRQADHCKWVHPRIKGAESDTGGGLPVDPGPALLSRDRGWLRPAPGHDRGAAPGEDALLVERGHAPVVGAARHLDQAERPGDLVGRLLLRPAAMLGPVGDLDHRRAVDAVMAVEE